MYCQKCGKEIDENADVCLGCGTLIPKVNRSKASLANALPKVLSIGTFIFCCIFAILGIICFGFLATNGFNLEMNEMYEGSYYMETDWFMPSIISTIAVSISVMPSIYFACHGIMKKLNIATACITVGYFILISIMILTSF